MKLLRLDLLAFGPFTDTSLDLSAGDSGLHIIYGPNEAGKSSTLRAIHGLLYGIPVRTTDTFLHDAKSIRIGALLENSEKKQLHFHRRKGNKDTLLNPAIQKGGAFSNDVLGPFLGGIDHDTFARVYGITHDELQKGGDEMKSLRGLVGESLFAATIGGSGLASLLSDLDAEATAIYHPKKISSELRKAAKTHKELQSDKRSLQLSKSKWVKLRDELKKAEKHRDDIVEREQTLAKELRGLQRIHNGLSLIGRRREVLAKLIELGDSVVLPSDYSSEQRVEALATLRSERDKIRRLSQLLSGDNSLQAEADAISIPDGLLDVEEEINELKDRRAITVKAESDIRLLRRDCESFTTQIEALLRDLGLGTSVEDAEKFRLTSEQRILISNLASDEKRLREDRTRLQRLRDESIEALNEVTEKLGALGAEQDVSDLERTVARVKKRGNLQAELAEIRADVESQQLRLEQQLGSLDLWNGSLDELKQLTLPLTETIDRFADEFSTNAQDLKLAEKQISKLDAEVLETQQAIAALQTEGHVPTETELNELRSIRDKRWQKIRKQFGSEKKPTDKSAVEYEDAVKTADQTADRLRREAERVAQLAERTSQQDRLTEEIRQLNEHSEKLSSTAEKLHDDWAAQWAPIGILAPLPPKEMQAWSRRCESLKQEANIAAEKQLEARRAEDRYTESRDVLATVLDSYAVKVSPKADLDELLEQATDHLKSTHTVLDHRKDLTKEIARHQKSIDSLAKDEKLATVEFEEWQAKWNSSMQLLGCDEEATAEQANARVQSLTELFEVMGRISAKEKRIRDIQTDATLFEDDVQRLASRFIPNESDTDVDGRKPSATDLALQLHIQLGKARSNRTRLDDLHDKLGETQTELADAKEREQALEKELEKLCSLAGVKAVDQLPSVERASDELTELRTRLKDLEEQLHSQSGNLTLDEFTTQAEACDADELPGRIETIERQLGQLETERDEAVSAVSELQRQTQLANGSDEAAQKDEQSLGLLSRMHRNAAQYMRLRFASTMLRKLIDEHRAENEDPLLERASTLFAHMTCGEFSGLKTEYENDEPIIVGLRKTNDESVPVTAMSDGTRDQLYLALRLGYVERQLIQNEPLPFIVDDILVHFDNDRSVATLEVLAELSKQTQVIFLTHHEHLTELAQEHLTAGDCFVHKIDSRNRIPRTPTSAITAKRPR